MSALYTAKQIAERALRKIGAYSINDSAADPAELEESLYWLDMAVGHLVETSRPKWLLPNTITKALTANQQTYTLATLLGSDNPTDGVLYVTGVSLRDSSGNDTPLDMLTKAKWDEITDKDQTGTPEAVYIDRLKTLTLKVVPVPTVSTFSILLDVQTYAPDLTASNGKVRHGFSNGWQLWQVLALAAQIGDGPVRKLPVAEVDRIINKSNSVLNDLLNYANREMRDRDKTSRRTAAWGA